jgi:hypothetical protein
MIEPYIHTDTKENEKSKQNDHTNPIRNGNAFFIYSPTYPISTLLYRLLSKNIGTAINQS